MARNATFFAHHIIADASLDHNTLARLRDMALELLNAPEAQRKAELKRIAELAQLEADDREAAFAAHALQMQAEAEERDEHLYV